MATNAERQAAYRERHRENGGGRINYAVTAHADAALKRLANAHGVTQRAMLEFLIANAESTFVQKFDAKAQKSYYDGE